MGSVRLIKNPFDRTTDIVAIDYGTNLTEIINNLELPETIKNRLVVYKLDNNLDNPVKIEKENWDKVFPQDNEHYQIFTTIMGRGSGKQITRMVGMIAIMVAAAWAGPALAAFAVGQGIVTAGSIGATAISVIGSAAVGIGGALLLNALVPPPGIQKEPASDSKRNLTSSSNSTNAYAPIPRIYGKTRFCPYKVANDYTEVIGDTTYMRSLFCFGYGPLKISDIKIGTNSLDTYSEVEYEIREGWEDDDPISLYTNTIRTQSYSIRLYNLPEPTVFTSLDMQEEVSFDINFPGGIWATRPNSGTIRWNGTIIEVKYRKKGDTDWIDFARESYVYTARSPFTKSFRIQFPEKGTYEMSVQQLPYPDWYGDDGVKSFCAAYLTTVRNITYEDPIRAKGLCLLAMRIKATDQLNGTLDGVSALCESYERVPGTSETVDSVEHKTITRQLDTLTAAPCSITYKSNIPIKEVKIDFCFNDGIYSNLSGADAKSDFSYEWTSDEANGNGTFTATGSDSRQLIISKDISQGVELNNFEITITRNKDESTQKNALGFIKHGKVTGPCTPKITYQTEITSATPIEENFVWKLNRHPAWHVYDILTGTAATTKVNPNLIDIESFKNWENTYPNWLVDVAIDGDFTRLDCIKSMCSAAKATFTIINGRYTIVLDAANKSPVAAISPRNSYGFSFSKKFEDEIHGLKVKYIEPERDWSEQEVIVYNSGYDETNATIFEGIESYGCTDRERAWKFGKYMLGQYIQRPETYTVSQDIENLAVNVGDLVLLSHDVLKVGIGQARIKEIYYNELGRAKSLWLDDKFYLPATNQYSIIIRNALGKLNFYSISPTDEETDIIDFPNAIPEGALPEIGDQVYIGISDRISMRTIITKIEPGDDFTATLTLVPEAPDIHDESDVDVPPFDPMITDTPEWIDKAPLAPLVENIVADERALIKDATGGYKAAVSFDVKTRPEETVKIASIQVYTLMENDAVTYRESFPYTGNDKIVASHVEDNRNCEIKVRYISERGISSEWTTFSVFVEGRSNNPPDVLNLDRQGYNITWNYDDKPLDFAGFRIYYNYGYNSWLGSAVRAHTESLWASPPFTTATLPKEILTLFVVAVDTAGNESSIPATISFYNGDVEYDNILWEYDYAENNFPGTITGGYVYDNLLISTATTNFYGSDNTKFYRDDKEKFYADTIYEKVTYEFVIEYRGEIDNAYIKLDWDIDGVYKIYYKRESQEPFYPELENQFYPELGDYFYKQNEFWYLMPDKLLIGNERVTIKIEIDSNSTIGRINKLTAKIDAPDVSELLSNVEISNKGTRLPLTKKFKVINKVFLTLVEGAGVVVPRVIDYNVTDGPMVALYDANGSMVEGIVNADIRGYK